MKKVKAEKPLGEPRYQHLRVGDVLDPSRYNARNMHGVTITEPCVIVGLHHKEGYTLITLNTDRGPKQFTPEWFSTK